MIMDIVREMEERYRIRIYRINYIFTLLSDADREASILLEKECCKHTAAMSDVCAIYNIMAAGNRKSGGKYAVSKIVGVVDVCLQSGEESGIPAVELAKRIAGNIFSVDITRQEADAIEKETRDRIP